MTGIQSRGLVPLLAVSGVVVLVVFGQAQGLWLANLHNGLLALAFTFVGAYVLFQRPGHREGVLFLVTGVVEGVMFCGRQIGHVASTPDSSWWGWLGVWPVAVTLALTTLSVIGFPDGRLPARGWRWVVLAVVGVAGFCAVLSAMWRVEYAAAGITTGHPINATTPEIVSTVWGAIAHPAYALFQVLWVVVIVVRWRGASGSVRRQLTWVLVAAALSVAALLIGVVGWQTPRPGLLAAALVPVAAGLAIVHGQHATSYSALSWLSRSSSSDDLATDLARAAAEALNAPSAVLWLHVGDGRLHAVGVWPESDADVEPISVAALGTLNARTVERRGSVTGALTISRTDGLSLHEARLFNDLASQGALVIDHLNLAEVVDHQRAAGFLQGLSPREGQVLELMARGLSNAAMCDELHLSIKTVEPIVSTIFVKLGLHPDAGSNRRVLAVLAYLQN